MNKAIHGSFTINRLYDAAPDRLFKAFADQKSKARWFVAPSGWKELVITQQGIFFDGQHGNEQRREGTAYLIEKIAVNLPN